MCGAPARAQLFPRGRFAPYRGGAGVPWEEDAFISLHGGEKAGDLKGRETEGHDPATAGKKDMP